MIFFMIVISFVVPFALGFFAGCLYRQSESKKLKEYIETLRNQTKTPTVT